VTAAGRVATGGSGTGGVYVRGGSGVRFGVVLGWFVGFHMGSKFLSGVLTLLTDARFGSNRNSRVHSRELLNHCGKAQVEARGSVLPSRRTIIATIQRVRDEGKAALWIFIRLLV